MNDRITMGHFEPHWDDDFKYLTYTKQPITGEESNAWINQGYDYVKSFSGSMYNNTNPMPKWISSIEHMFGLYNQTYNFYKMDTLEIMPTHVDHYRTYMRLNNVNYNDVYRVVVMLEDWKPGHYFELDGIGYVNWKAGDWFMWRGDVPHAAANIGLSPRYTLQVTGVSVYSGQLNDLFCYNVPGVPTQSAGMHPFLKHTVLPATNPSFDKCQMIYMDNLYIKALDDISHSELEAKKINRSGLHIYLYEPMCSYKQGSLENQHNCGFYSEFDNVTPDELRSEELDSILNYAERNKLSNITVHTGDYDVETWYPHYASKVNLLTDDLFLKTRFPIQNVMTNSLMKFNIEKKFLNLNWRYTKHRNLVAVYLTQRSANVSWYFDVPFGALKENLFFDLDAWQDIYPDMYKTLQDGTEYAHVNGPLVVDVPALKPVHNPDGFNFEIWPSSTEYSPGTTPALYNDKKNTLQPHYEDIFVDVITETRFAQPTANFSEKVFQAIQYFRPFILLAPPFTLEYVKEFGFRTFSDFWDESYDTERDHGKRLAMIFKLFDSLEQQSIDDLREMGIAMQPILEHNRNIFIHNIAVPLYKV